LNAFVKLRTATISFVMCVPLSVRPSGWNNSTPNERIFIKFNIWTFFSENPSRKFKFHQTITTITGTLHEDRYTFLIISRSVLLRMRNVSDKSCRENDNTHFALWNFLKNRVIYEIMWENILERAGHRWQYGACALHAGYPRLHTHTHTHTHRICNTNRCSTTMTVKRTCLGVTLPALSQ